MPGPSGGRPWIAEGKGQIVEEEREYKIDGLLALFSPSSPLIRSPVPKGLFPPTP